VAEKITCLCPTYGRFARLRTAVACFLLQDYPNRELIILNDGPVPILPGALADWRDAPVRIVNAPERFTTLGAKRQALIELAETDLVCHWDDDDWMLPWHLSSLADALTQSGQPCAHQQRVWYVVGPGRSCTVSGAPANTFEALMLFLKSALDGLRYSDTDSGQCLPLLHGFRERGQIEEWKPEQFDLSYVYRWHDGLDHISGRRDRPSRDADHGAAEGGVLLPNDFHPPQWAHAHMGRPFTRLSDQLTPFLGETIWAWCARAAGGKIIPASEEK